MGRAFPQCAFECVPLDFLSAWSALSNERTEKAYRLRVTWCAGSMTSCRQRLFRTLHDGEFLVKTHWDFKKNKLVKSQIKEKRGHRWILKNRQAVNEAESSRRLKPLGGGWDEEASWGSAKSREWETDNLLLSIVYYDRIWKPIDGAMRQETVIGHKKNPIQQGFFMLIRIFM